MERRSHIWKGTQVNQQACLPASASGRVAVGITLRKGHGRAFAHGRVSPSFLGCLFRYSPKSPALQSETVHYKRGVSQQFSLPSFKIDFSEWKDDEVTSCAFPEFLPLCGGQESGACLLRFLTWSISIRSGCQPRPVLSRACTGLWGVAWPRCWPG